MILDTLMPFQVGQCARCEALLPMSCLTQQVELVAPVGRYKEKGIFLRVCENCYKILNNQASQAPRQLVTE
jgi:hypothetical protein